MQIACNYKQFIHSIQTTAKKYGYVTRFILGTDIYVVLTKPENCKLVLTKEIGNNKSIVTKLWKSFFGDGIIRVSGAPHRLRRKIIQPLMNVKYLYEYVTFFDIYSNCCVDALEKHVDGPTFDLKQYMEQYAVNIYLETIVGIQGTAHKGELDGLLNSQETLFKGTYNRVIKPWLQTDWIFSLTKKGKQMRVAQNTVLDFMYSVLPQKTIRPTALNNKIFQKVNPVFHNYWKRVVQVCGNVTNEFCKVSDENCIDDMRNFLIAIHSTITEITTFIIIMLAMHTEVQEKLREEIFVTLNNDKIDAQSLYCMQYLQMVFKETLRLFPVAPVLSRALTEDIKLESCTLPEGCFIMIPIIAIHRNPVYWPKPLEFIPERFSSENSSNRHRYTYIPFGTGLRDCIGQKYAFLCVATLIANLVRRYRFSTTISNIDDIKLTTDIVLRSQDVKCSISRV
ncbi:cytochrome P450 4C1 isoform X2 [Solenopsis invicta]|uniref:cytochrome P450 4C1 isoform X2 n=1 Tax=Solenopsis invicta TaxID=13686 RepID=UPI00059593D2|nr:cytochrome P450 4C1 isoform X2 [Solenopsis invicta]